MRSRGVRMRRRFFVRRRYRRFFRPGYRALFRRYYRPYVRRPHNSALNTVLLRPNWTDNILPTVAKTRHLLSFKFDDLPELEKFKSLFGYYRFVRFYTKCIPKVTVLQDNTSSGTYVAVPWHRYIDEASLEKINADDLLDLTRSKARRCNQVMYNSVVPAVVTNSNVLPNSTMRTITYRPWIKIDRDGTAVQHFGLLYAFPSDSLHITFQIVTRCYVQLRGYSV